MNLLRGMTYTPRSRYYVMSHWPGQAPTSWKRLFYAALAHGAKIIDLYEMHSTFLVRTILLLVLLVGPLAPQEIPTFLANERYCV